MSKHVWEKCGKLCISSFLSSKRDITPTKIDTNQQHSILICRCIKIKSYTKFQLNMSKHVWEKCGKLCISSFLSSKRDITPTKIDTNQQHSILICRCIKIKSYTKFQLNMSKHVREKCGKLWRMDGRTSPYHNKFRLKLTTKFSRQYRYLSHCSASMYKIRKLHVENYPSDSPMTGMRTQGLKRIGLQNSHAYSRRRQKLGLTLTLWHSWFHCGNRTAQKTGAQFLGITVKRMAVLGWAC